jgi:hypothetical protein
MISQAIPNIPVCSPDLQPALALLCAAAAVLAAVFATAAFAEVAESSQRKVLQFGGFGGGSLSQSQAQAQAQAQSCKCHHCCHMRQ